MRWSLKTGNRGEKTSGKIREQILVIEKVDYVKSKSCLNGLINFKRPCRDFQID